MGVIWLLFAMIRHLYLIDVWLDEDERTTPQKHRFKEIGRLCLHILSLTTSPSTCSEHN